MSKYTKIKRTIYFLCYCCGKRTKIVIPAKGILTPEDYQTTEPDQEEFLAAKLAEGSLGVFRKESDTGTLCRACWLICEREKLKQDAHRHSSREYMWRKRIYRKIEGTCVLCGSRKPQPGKTCCVKCKKRKAVTQRRRREHDKKNGLTY